jgi:hypothetical protein
MSGMQIAEDYSQMAAVIIVVVVLTFWIKRTLMSWSGSRD